MYKLSRGIKLNESYNKRRMHTTQYFVYPFGGRGSTITVSETYQNLRHQKDQRIQATQRTKSSGWQRITLRWIMCALKQFLYRRFLTKWGNLRERDHWGDQDVDGGIILRWICRKWEGVVGTGWSWLRIGTGGGHL